MTKVSVSLKPRLNEVLLEKWQKVLCQSLPPRQLHAWEAKEKEAEAGAAEGANSPSSNLGIANFRFTDCHGTATSSSAVDSQHLQKIQGWKMPKPRFSWQRQSSFLRSWEGYPQNYRLGLLTSCWSYLEGCNWINPAEKMQTNYKWRIWLEKHWGIFCTQKNRTSCAPVCPFGLQHLRLFCETRGHNRQTLARSVFEVWVWWYLVQFSVQTQ